MRTITLEEHCVTKNFLQATKVSSKGTPPALKAMQERLQDVGAGRLSIVNTFRYTVKIEKTI